MQMEFNLILTLKPSVHRIVIIYLSKLFFFKQNMTAVCHRLFSDVILSFLSDRVNRACLSFKLLA